MDPKTTSTLLLQQFLIAKKCVAAPAPAPDDPPSSLMATMYADDEQKFPELMVAQKNNKAYFLLTDKASLNIKVIVKTQNIHVLKDTEDPSLLPRPKL